MFSSSSDQHSDSLQKIHTRFHDLLTSSNSSDNNAPLQAFVHRHPSVDDSDPARSGSKDQESPDPSGSEACTTSPSSPAADSSPASPPDSPDIGRPRQRGPRPMRVRSRTTCIKCDACVLDIRRHYRSINPYSEVQLCTTRRGIRFTLPPDMYCRHGYIIKVYPVRGCGKTATRMNLHLRRAHGLGTNALARRQDPPRMSPCRGGGPGGTSRQPSTTGPLRPIDPPTRTSPKHQFTSDRGHLPTHSARGHFRPILDAYVEERDVAPP